ncbi:MAG TPA: S9 family peptidase [Streptosporangiaceae bacterium]|nr:S9 family peptidase [Streptosporangiaceae bacterium]
MSTQPAGIKPAISEPATANGAPGLAVAAPPPARQIRTERRHHGDTVVDEYAWLADKQDPETIAFLEAQNAYTAAITADQADLREAIFGEIKGRTKETDLSVPVRKGGWWYYSRTVQGQQYPVRCRRAVRPDDQGPPMTEDGSPLDGEEILLDGNELAGSHPYFSLGAYSISPDGSKLAYSTDFAGDERFTLRVKDLVTGEIAADQIPNTYYRPAWSRDGSALFYLTVDDAWRPYRVWRHLIGTPAAQDTIVFEEPDERFFVSVSLTRSERFLVIAAVSKLTTESWLLDADRPEGKFRVVVPRRQGVDYRIEHQAGAGGADRLLILHNDGAENFELATAALEQPGAWAPLIPHRADTRLIDVGAFESHLVVYFRRDGLTGLRFLRADGSEHEVAFDEVVYHVTPGANPEYASRLFRLGYGSLVTPDSVYDCDTRTGELILLRQRPVLTLPGQEEYRTTDYSQHREWATAPDGTLIPISLVCRKGTPRDGSAPLLLFGYGSYEASSDPYLSVARLSLLDRGFSFAIAHVRGGGEMGRHWYDDGKLLNKINSFADFIACARHLADSGWTSPGRLIARGGSAGGLLMGAAANMAPEAFGGIAAQVPFVDALTTILDPSLPLTVTEWEEWGDPLHDPDVYAYMKSYSPYENIATDRSYPPILAVTSLNDTRVQYAEPAKWIARLQALASGGPFLLKTEMVAGHGGRSGRYDAWHEEAMVLAWILATARGSGSRPGWDGA